ncbi:MAG: hypothetical protein GC203_22170 [Phenylobacterium sp.]|uniref:hypothetical protein n=1 Tax=Phenylobacterium sp. TaxID=1871053 RepID=UPI0025D8092C|nr:hypothetical protein [Phenylobacterium sp.]MBI1200577.1 hypothetical protein [Phenylobacterium sp.]
MSESVEERRGRAERLRDYFEVQLLFAERLADRTSRPISDVCLEFTNLHRRFGLGRVGGPGPAADWTRYSAGLERCKSASERLDWTVDFFSNAPSETGSNPRFGCFSYEGPTADGAIRIHFSNRDSEDGVGPLARAKADRRIADLGEMFGHVRTHHPKARSVLGGSWLYNLEAYCRLFPSEYVASRFLPDRVRLDGTSTWGQLLDFRERVKPAVRDAVLKNLDEIDAAEPWRAFPLRALRTQCDVEQFYRHYQV